MNPSQDVRCPYCKEPSDAKQFAKLEHPIRAGDWMVRCEGCDVWTIVTMVF